MTTLLETIKKHDAKMEALTRTNERLEQTLMSLVDDLIDRDLTLCVDQDYLSKAVQMLKNRGLMDYTRNESYDQVQQGLCDQSVRLKQVIKTITGKED
jgi:energy-converting hydrogenase A subunit M